MAHQILFSVGSSSSFLLGFFCQLVRSIGNIFNGFCERPATFTSDDSPLANDSIYYMASRKQWFVSVGGFPPKRSLFSLFSSERELTSTSLSELWYNVSKASGSYLVTTGKKVLPLFPVGPF